jgi:hypothetical protein
MRTLRMTLLAVGLAAPAAMAQPVAIDWYTIDCGGGTSSALLPGGQTVTIQGTIGQPDAGGPMTAGNVTVVGGFWAFGVFAPPPPCDPDFNQDGNADQDDYASLVNVVAGGECP